MKKVSIILSALSLVYLSSVAFADAPVVDAYTQGVAVAQPKVNNTATTKEVNNQQPLVSIQSFNQPPTKQTFVQANNQQTEQQANVPQSVLMMQNQAQLLGRINALQQQMTQLRGLIQLQQHNLENVTKQQQVLYKELDGRLTALGNSGNVDTTNNIASATPAIKKQQAGLSLNLASPSVGDKLVYEAAFKEIKAKNYTQAMLDLQKFLHDYQHSRYVPNAHYWLGELYLISGKINNAVQQFQAIVSQFPKNAKAADALLKLGLVYYGQGKWQLARNEFTKVTEQFPESSSAHFATNRLKQMDMAGK